MQMVILTRRNIAIVPKKCDCGNVHYQAPVGTQLFDDQDDESGRFSYLLWNCACTSTITIPLEQIELPEAV